MFFFHLGLRALSYSFFSFFFFVFDTDVEIQGDQCAILSVAELALTRIILTLCFFYTSQDLRRILFLFDFILV